MQDLLIGTPVQLLNFDERDIMSQQHELLVYSVFAELLGGLLSR